MDLPQIRVSESKNQISFAKIAGLPAMFRIVPCSTQCILPAYHADRLETIYTMGRVR